MNITANNMTYEELKALLQYVETLENKEDYSFSLSLEYDPFSTLIKDFDPDFENFVQAINDSVEANKD